MAKHHNSSNYYFWGLVLLTSLLVSLGLFLGWLYGQTWIQTLWHICQSSLQNFVHHPQLLWQMIIPAILLMMIGRSGVSLYRQIRATSRLVQTFYPFSEIPPQRLQNLFAVHNLTTDNIVYLQLATPHAFCLGFVRPRIWLTSGLVELLSDTELSAVLAHEAHHLHQRDPLRLVVSRTLKAAFFFLPLVGDLARAAELQQEITADKSAMAAVKSDLPLLCALQKLMKYTTTDNMPDPVAYSPFNVTEARLRRLLYPPTPANWHRHLSKGILNFCIILLLGSITFLSARSTVSHTKIVTCTPEIEDTLQMQSAWLDYSM